VLGGSSVLEPPLLPGSDSPPVPDEGLPPAPDDGLPPAPTGFRFRLATGYSPQAIAPTRAAVVARKAERMMSFLVMWCPALGAPSTIAQRTNLWPEGSSC